MAGPLPMIILLALGAGALGGPDALRDLLQFAGRSPLLDIAICVFAMGVVTAYLLGTALLVRFVREARPGAGLGGGAQGAAATDCFAQVTLTVSVGVGYLVTACLLVVPFVASGGLGTLRFVLCTAGNGSFVAVAVMAAASVRCIMPLVRFFRTLGNADRAAPAVPATTSKNMYLTASSLVAVCLLLVVVSFVASGGLDAQRLVPGLPWRSPIINMPVGVAMATVAGTTLLVLFHRRAHNAAGAAAPTPAMDTRRFAGPMRVASLAVVSSALACFLAIPFAYAQPKREADGGRHACSV